MTTAEGGAVAQTPRDPAPLWPWFRGFVTAAIVCDATLVLTQTYEAAVGPPDFSSGANPLALIWALVSTVAGIANMVVYVICIVLTLKLTHRLMRNLHLQGAPGVSISPAMAAGSYFIPFVNLVLPVRAVGQIWRGTFALAGEESRRGPIGWWWAAWLIGNFLGTASFRLSAASGAMDGASAPDPGLYALAVYTGLANSLIVIAAELLMLAVFRPIVRAQTKLLNAEAFA